MLVGSFTRSSCVLGIYPFARAIFLMRVFLQVKKRMREDARVGGGTRAANGYGGRGQGPREDSPEAESDEDDEQSYDHGHMPGR
jgi:hypothetical protein